MDLALAYVKLLGSSVAIRRRWTRRSTASPLKGKLCETLIVMCGCAQTLNNMYHRWAPEMETEALKVSHWRKSSQWAVLRRDHAHIIADDREVAEQFTKHCYMEWRDNVWRDCYSDEHYLGTLLASRVQSPSLPLSAEAAGEFQLNLESREVARSDTARQCSSDLVVVSSNLSLFGYLSSSMPVPISCDHFLCSDVCA